jgi:hypothetical protein
MEIYNNERSLNKINYIGLTEIILRDEIKKHEMGRAYSMDG